MNVTWTALNVPGALLSSGASLRDERGAFTKVLSGHDHMVGDFVGREVYWTRSSRGVLRGLHFQTPPDACRKLVFVVNGRIRDFLVDLRVGSPMEGAMFEVELSPDTGALLVPIGCAHAYEALEEDTIVCYVQDVPFNGEKTYAGINILSAGIIPQSPNPIMMPRDLEFPNLADFESPFIYEG
jgi:dTDP-4-dehydrorhamnose 3,5-epimerase